MAVLPDKILEDYEIEAFINRVNSSSEKIVSNPKFKISNPNLPGIGLLLKLQIRAFEKGLASAFAPIFLGKKALSEGFGGIVDAFQGIQTIFTNPIQFLLDEGVNSVLEDFPFPLRLEVGGGITGSAVNKLKDLLSDTKQTGDSFGAIENFNYELVFNSPNLPKDGEITTQASNLNQISTITVSSVTNTSESNDLISNIRTGDKIQLSDDQFTGSFIVGSVAKNNNNSVTLGLSLDSLSEISQSTGQKTIPGFKNTVLSTQRSLLLRSFLDSEGRIVIPISVLGISLPLLSSLSVVLGDFNKLKDSSPTKKFINGLEERSGITFNETLLGIFDGKFPNIDFQKLQKDSLDGNEESSEKAKEDFITLARLIEIGSSDPFFLIKILFNYIKLLLLPISVVIGVIKGLKDLITGPIALIRIVIQGITNPLGLICDLISRAFLEVLRPYIQNPIISIGLTWEESLNQPNSNGRGLQPMISDMVCGKFSRDLKNYIPNQSFFDSLKNSLPGDASQPQLGPTIPYNTFFESQIPGQGEISVNNKDIMLITTFNVSNFSNTVENSTGLLSSLNVGDEFTFSFSDVFAKYRISSKRFVVNASSSYFVLEVQFKPSDFENAKNKSILELQKDGINFESLKSSLSVNNPDRTLLFIIERYLPVEMVAIFESIKGILAIFGGLALQVPSLLPAIIRSLFGLNLGKSKEEILAKIEGEESGDVSSAISGVSDVLDLIYNGDSSLMFLATDNEARSGSNFSPEAREALSDLIQNSESSNDPGIENVFYELAETLKLSGQNASIFRDQLSLTPGRNTSVNEFLNFKKGDNLEFRNRAPDKSDFFYGQLSLIDVGKSVKVLSEILIRFENQFYFSDSNVKLDDFSITVYSSATNNSVRETIFTGNVFNALNRFKFTNQSINDRIKYRDLRIIVNREIDFLIKYGLPSLQ